MIKRATRSVGSRQQRRLRRSHAAAGRCTAVGGGWAALRLVSSLAQMVSWIEMYQHNLQVTGVT